MTAVLPALDPQFSDTRVEVQRVVVHVVARARVEGTGRFGLRITPGGVGTPAFGPELTVVRMSGSHLMREVGGVDRAATSVASLLGASLGSLANDMGVDLDDVLTVGHDTPPLGDTSTPLTIHEPSLHALLGWFTFAGVALDRFLAAHSDGRDPALIQLWPEHFDVAVDLAARPEVRCNIGASAGDAGSDGTPYLYVGPWTSDRPGDDGYWNVPYGAALGYEELRAADDPTEAGLAFWAEGLHRLSAA